MSRAGRVRRTLRVMFVFGFRAAPRWMAAMFALSLLGAVSQGAVPYGFKVVADAFLAGDRHLLWTGVVLVAVLGALYWASAILAATVLTGLNSRVDLYVSGRVAALANAVSGVHHMEDREYLRQLDLIEENRFLIGYAPGQTLTLLQVLVRMAVIVALLASIYPPLAALPLLGIAPFLAESRSVRMSQAAEEATAEDRRLANELFGLAAAAAPAKELRVFGARQPLERLHADAAARVSATTGRTAVRAAAWRCLGWAVFAAGFLGGLAVIVVRAVHGQATAGQVLMAVALAQQTQVQMTQIADAVGKVITMAKTAQRYLWVEDYAEASAGGDAVVPAAIRDGIAFEDVGFRYPGTDKDVLEHITLRLAPGTAVAVVGENGAGKTTLVKLLAQMYRPTSGRITVDGVDLSAFDPAAWRAHCAAAFQDFVRFELRAGEAVGVGDLPRRVDDAAVATALDRAGAPDLGDELADGLATPLGFSMGGVDLSGGQWQKVALGRSMMRDAPLLLILDEPTASLDAPTEHALFERYVAAARRSARANGAITVLVSHRFSTVHMADVIVVLDGGRVVEVGTHADLQAAGGLYAGLFELQAQGFR